MILPKIQDCIPIRIMRAFHIPQLALIVVGLTAVTVPAPAAPLSRQQAYERAAHLSNLGEKLFSDTSLSGSGKIACATCHDPNHAFGPANDLAVQPGGYSMDKSAGRAAPTLTYLQAVPQFTEHFFDSDEDGDESVDAGPTGGLTWDGRVDRKRQQALIPLFSPAEMANQGTPELLARVKVTPYADMVTALGGADIFAHPDQAMALVAEALETFQQRSDLFYRYDSKYDSYLAGRAQLTAQEKRGLDVFNDPEKGNCDSCHPSQPSADGAAPQFSDWGFIALGLPRNDTIPANADSSHFDLGLCGPDRTDFADRPEYCGLFRTVSLRNVATKRSFFHNGIYHDLRQAVAFYADRDSRPEKVFPRSADGGIARFNDLPRPYWDNLETDVPFGKKAGETPRLSDADIDDIVAFLKTLTDGYSPAF